MATISRVLSISFAAFVSFMLSDSALSSGNAQAVEPALITDGYMWPRKDTPDASIYRGSIVFTNYCALCHGVAADGKGRAARLYNPRPANLVMSDKNDTYKELIIRRGGEGMGRSKFMPPWGNELTDEQTTDVVNYLRSINRYKEK